MGWFEFPLWLGAAVLVGAGQAAKSSVGSAPDFRAKNVPIFEALGFGTKVLRFAHPAEHRLSKGPRRGAREGVIVRPCPLRTSTPAMLPQLALPLLKPSPRRFS